MNDEAVWEDPSQMVGESRLASARRAAAMNNGTREIRYTPKATFIVAPVNVLDAYENNVGLRRPSDRFMCVVRLCVSKADWCGILECHFGVDTRYASMA